ncbi:ArnT family glycosyltransferase [Mucilaginibacter auburnensis]|uniref:4-amino-4-deoxy-L-arabinose transferase-like glycosyltransferase n=1 Tax=Mucilaginibacter auburnensis TaxID=1457233 RepID=A0A2H9VT26_9SPHI|nr:glycosyltransferase family 39 protein [Mucilaginibacter auburnensis]PJJ83959.1 4-amino-4-deoxy-L-arabinose transferase-like glycosyltransferase [Mucilaginibacter auburnensis]
MSVLPGSNIFSKSTDKGVQLFVVILIVNLIQSFSSLLLNDEPYYWMYSQHLAWGYFDHPPAIAFLIKLGSSLFAGEIGVRLITTMLGSLTFYLIYKIIEEESNEAVNFKLSILLLTSSIFLNLYSFLAIPDTPMLFFAALFFYTYRNYLKEDNVVNAVVLGLVTALLLYSKYHGILIVFFTLLSNFQLFLKRSFYIVFITALLLYLPHINWQIINDYPTLKFQFSGRATAFSIQHVLSYVGEQAAVTGPVVLLLFTILYKPKNQFQKSLKYSVVGVFVFFLISSFKDMVNVHWTAIAWPGMISISYLYIKDLKKHKKVVYGLLVFNLVLVIILRVNLVANFFSIPNFNDKNPEVMASTLQKEAMGLPLVFADTYIEPAYYSFYQQKPAFAVNSVWYKKTQYNFMPWLEKQFQGKKVAYISEGGINKSSRRIEISRGKTYYITTMDNFASFTGANVNVVTEQPLKAAQKAVFKLAFDGKQLTPFQHKELKTSKAFIMLTFINNETNEAFCYKCLLPADTNNASPFEFTFTAPKKPGKYRYVLSVAPQNSFSLGLNSPVYHCTIR